MPSRAPDICFLVRDEVMLLAELNNTTTKKSTGRQVQLSLLFHTKKFK
jgi:hypothetical protein